MAEQIKKPDLDTPVSRSPDRESKPDGLVTAAGIRRGRSAVERSEQEIQWDAYWKPKTSLINILYDAVASLYRILLIRPMFRRFMRKTFAPGSEILHAGCGGGQVDQRLENDMNITALDISLIALGRYKRLIKRCSLVHASIFEMPFKNDRFDGVYNLGVMEHFHEQELHKMLGEFHRVLKPGGRLVLFWPPVYSASIHFLDFLMFVLNRVLKLNVVLFPEDYTRIQSKDHVRGIVTRAGFVMVEYYFGIRDFFTQCVVICEKPQPESNRRV